AGGDVPLTPIQRWFAEQPLPDPNHFNQALLLEATERLDPDRLARALACVADHHGALGQRFVRDGEGWRQGRPTGEADREGPTLRRVVEVPSTSAAEEAAFLDRLAGELHGSLDISQGPL